VPDLQPQARCCFAIATSAGQMCFVPVSSRYRLDIVSRSAGNDPYDLYLLRSVSWDLIATVWPLANQLDRGSVTSCEEGWRAERRSTSREARGARDPA
jgi:hypothetical protein